MMIAIFIITVVIALLFGKIAIKEIKQYVRKHTEGKEDKPEERDEKGADRE